MKQTYSLPVKVIIESEHADAVMRRISEVMYDAVKAFCEDPANEFDDHVEYFDMDWSIYTKADKKTFGL